MTLAVLCSGQGGQTATMFEVLEREPGFDALVALASDAAGFDVVDIVGSEAGRASMFDNAIAQPLICADQLIAWSLLRSRLDAIDLAPLLFAGYSVGELCAHGCAGGLRDNDTIALARDRAAAMDAAGGRDEGLVAIRGLAQATVAALGETHATSIAIVNGDDQFIVGGSAPDLDRMAADVVARGGSAQRLPIGIASHTPRLDDALEPFRERLAGALWQPLSAPVVAGIDATIVRDSATAIDRLSRQLAVTIRWSACMDAIVERGVTTCLELGPGNALARMMRERHPAVASRSIADFRSVDAVVEWVRRSRA